MTQPTRPVHYARNGDVALAYQVVGDGPVDLVYVPGYVSHLDLTWEWPPAARLFERLAQFSRLILIDKRGTGLSDRCGTVPLIEDQIDDLRAVLDATGSERPVVFGVEDGFAIAAILAATAPERIAAIIAFASRARGLADDDYPLGWHRGFIRAIQDNFEQNWGAATLQLWAPSFQADPKALDFWRRYCRSAAGPSTAQQMMANYCEFDLRAVLPTLRQPTVVLHRVDEVVTPVELGRDLADRIEGARFVELPGDSAIPWIGDVDGLADEIEEFVTGHRPVAPVDRVLATILFTDVVGSTERAAELGDRRWRELLDGHDAAIADEVARARGRVVKTAGDGVLATFDGPGRAVHCAAAIGRALGALGIDVRSGVHTGEIELRGDDVGGIAVHIAARVMALAPAGAVYTSATVKDLVVGSDITFEDRGTHQLKGVAGDWRIHAAVLA